MNRLAWTYVILVFLPAIALAFFAFRVADQDYAEGLEARRRGLAAAAETLVSQVEATLADADRRADEILEEARRALASEEELVTEEILGFAQGGKWLGFDLPRSVGGSEESFLPRDLELFRLSRHGGEHYELVQKDPEMALDAYAFYLTRIQARALRDRLRFRVARAALAAGRQRLGRCLLEELMSDAGQSPSEEGLPLDVLAALRLVELADREPPEEAERLHSAVREHLRRRHRGLSTDLLTYVTSGTRVKDPVLDRWIARRRALEDALDRYPKLLVDREAHLEGKRLLLARQLREGSALRAILHLPVSLPPLLAGADLDTHLALVSSEGPGPGETPAAQEPPTDGEVVRSPVRLGDEGPILAYVEVRDGRMNEVLGALRRRRNLQQTMIGLLVAMTLAGGGALVYYLRRERRLARLRTQLLANVSHELKTPATSIRMLSEMLAKDDLEETKSKRFADLLHGESLRLGRIIENVLEFSRLERGRQELTRERVDLSGVLRRVFESFSYRTRDEELELTREGAHVEVGEAPVEVISNAAAIECILFNLIDNAVKYSKVKTGDAEYRPEISLDVDVDRARSVVRISVTDNGIGICPDDQKKIFEEFYRARFDDYGVRGTGLGLSISRALARRLGGEIDVRSVPGEGSTFVLTLPLSSSLELRRHEDESLESHPERAPSRRRTGVAPPTRRPDAEGRPTP